MQFSPHHAMDFRLVPQSNSMSGFDDRWDFVFAQFMNALPNEYRSLVAELMLPNTNGVLGLRRWLSEIAYQGKPMPESVPNCLLDIYLRDPEALPLHDCESCGQSVPVRVAHTYGYEDEAEYCYFPDCPWCGSRTGLHYYWSNLVGTDGCREVRQRAR